METAEFSGAVKGGGPLMPPLRSFTAHFPSTAVLRMAFIEETLRAGRVHKWANDLIA